MISILEVNKITPELISYYESHEERIIIDYEEIIEVAKKRGLDKNKLNGYYERHHIVPCCMNGKDEDENYVLLTYPEHILAHMLLHLRYPEHFGLGEAFRLLISAKDKIDQIEVDLALLESLKIKLSESMKGINNPMRDPKTREKLSNAMKGVNNPNFGKSCTEEMKLRLSKANGIPVISPDGKKYNSFSEASRLCNIPNSTLRRWTKSNPSKGWKRACTQRL